MPFSVGQIQGLNSLEMENIFFSDDQGTFEMSESNFEKLATCFSKAVKMYFI